MRRDSARPHTIAVLVLLLFALAASWSGASAALDDDWCDCNGWGEPAWSPDGSRIAISLSGDIAVVLAAGGACQPLVSGTGVEAQPAWSPDGSVLACASNREGSLHIYIAPAAGGEPRQPTTGPANDTWPTWSPDGRYVAFASDRSGGTHLWSVAAAGGTPVQVTSGGDTETAPAWSPASLPCRSPGTAPASACRAICASSG